MQDHEGLRSHKKRGEAPLFTLSPSLYFEPVKFTAQSRWPVLVGFASCQGKARQS